MNKTINKPYYPCEHCIHFYQHYGLTDERINKLGCGRCNTKNQIVKITQRKCKFFEELTKEMDRTAKEKRAIYVLSNIEKTLANLKLYFNNAQPSQQVDECLLDKLKH